MSRISLMAAEATRRAIADARLSEDVVRHHRTGVSYGSTMGGTSAIEKCFRSMTSSNGLDGFLSTTFLQIMSHTCAANLAIAMGIRGRLLASCTACASSLQAVGLGYETIKHGLADVFFCGGAEELHPMMIGVFDTMKATSTANNDSPARASKPFDVQRDGLVVGEGAGTLVLEDAESAQRRGATLLAEVVGFSTGSDGGHMTNPSAEAMERVMREALADAGLSPEDVSFVNAHATATPVGDLAESRAIHALFGTKTPVNSLKGALGHLMGACGVVELGACLGMLERNRILHTLNLETPDPESAPLDHVMGAPRGAPVEVVLKNSFGFGGVNASLVLKKVAK
jgi:3-oxoacyl-[acyl-carrier-protein] synthase II